MGAKCSSILIETPDITILVDPGAASMQGSYPLPLQEKERLQLQALRNIGEASKSADFVFISHYHYDHYTPLMDIPREVENFYKGKTVWAKDPNKFINHSQWNRARIFFGGLGGKEIYKEPEGINYKPIEEELPIALSRNYGDYGERKKELLEKGKIWFEKLLNLWQTNQWIREFKTRDYFVKFIDGKRYKFGDTIVRFTQPLFHGIEYDRVGWVISLVVENNHKKFLYSSDLQGPQIEDYADWIIQENPDAMVLDGPATYLFGFMMNRINLNRAISNMVKIIKKTKTNPIIYDHHLLREGKYKERLKEVYKKGKSRVLTAAEFMGREPLILTLRKQR
jgi:hypothetical protein